MGTMKLWCSSLMTLISSRVIRMRFERSKRRILKIYNLNDIIYAGRRLNVSLDTKWRRRNNVVDVFFLVDNSYLNTFFLNESEVYGLCECPISELLRAHEEDYSFDVEVLKHDWTKEK